MADIVEDVGLELDPTGITAGLNGVQKQLTTMAETLQKNIREAAGDIDKVSNNIAATVKGMQQAMGQMQTLAKFASNPNQNVQTANAQKQAAGQILSATQFSRGLTENTNAATALQGRINDLDRAIVKMGQDGSKSLASLNDTKTRDALTEQLALVKKLDTEYTALERRATRTVGGTQALAPQAANVATSRELLNAVASDPKATLDEITQATMLATRANDEYAVAIAAVRKEQADEIVATRNLEKTTADYYAAVEAAETKRQAQLREGAALSSAGKAGLTRQQEIDAAYAQAAAGPSAAIAKTTDAAYTQDAKAQVPTDYEADLEAFRVEQDKKLAIELAAAEKASGVRAANQAKQEAQDQKDADEQIANQQKIAEAAEKAASVRARNTVPTDVADMLKANGYEQTRLNLETQIAGLRKESAGIDDNEVGSLEKQAALTEQIALAQKQLTEAGRQNKANNPLTPSEGGGLGSQLATAAKQTLIYSTLYGLLSDVETGFKDAVEAALKFNDTLDTVKAISGGTDGQMQQLKATIYDVGETSKFTVQELAQATVTLAQAGESIQGIQQGIKAAADLGAATGSTLAESVDAITGALNTFHLQESEQGHIADVITAAANKTKLTMAQLTQGFQTAGVAADENGVSFEELTASLGVLASAGTKSRTAGTGLAALLTDLEAPSLKLSNAIKAVGLSYDQISVKEHGLSEVLNTLREAGFGTADAFESMSSSAARTFVALSADPDAISRLQTQFNEVGSATVQAAVATQSFTSKFTEFKNNLQEGFANSGFVEFFTTAGAAVLDFINHTSAVDKAIAPLQATGDAINAQKEQLEQYGDGSAATRDKIDQLTSSYIRNEAEIANVAQATQDAVDTSALYNKALDDAFTKSNDANNAVQQHAQSQGALSTAISQVYARQNDLKGSSSALAAETTTLISRFAGLAQYINVSANSYDNLTLSLRKYQAQQALSGALQATVAADAAESAGRASADVATGSAKVILANQGNIYGSVIPALVRSLISNSGGVGRGGELGNLTILTQIKDAVQQLPPALRSAASITVGNFTTAFAATRAKAGERDSNKATASGLEFAASAQGQALTQEVNTASAPGTSDSSRKALIAKLVAILPKFDKGVQLYINGLIGEVQAGINSVGKFTDAKPHKGPKDKQPGIQTSLDAGDVSAADKTLSEDLAQSKKPVTIEAFNADAEKIDKDLAAYVQAKNDYLASAITSKKLDNAQIEQLSRTTAQDIQTKTAEVARKINETFNNFITSQLKAADEALTKALQPSKNALAIQQGLATSLTRDNIKDKVPDYVTQLQAKNVAQAKDAADAASIPANEQYASALTKVYNDEAAQLAKLTASNSDGSNTNLIDDLGLKMLDLQNKIQTVNDGIAATKASFEGSSLLPTTFADAITKAAEAYQIAGKYGNSFSDDIKQNLTGALGEGQTAFTDFFTNIFTGTKSVTSAFASMVQDIIKYVEKLAAELIAKQVFGLLLNLIAPTGNKTLAGVAGGTGDVDTLVGGVPGVGGNFNGGPAMPGFDTGGQVMNGSANRDSVVSKLAKGEWVINKKAVDSVGNGFMAKLNSQGSKALSGMTSAIPPISFSGGHQETSVYVVKPDQQPTLGKNDVLVAIQDDIMKGGETKKLIKYVSQGG